jgi:hypothetical protein
VLAAASEPPFQTSGFLVDGRLTFNIKQLWRVASHLGLDFERFRGAERVLKHLERAGLAKSARNEQTRYFFQYSTTESGISQTRLNLDRLVKIQQLKSQAKTMHQAIKKQFAKQPPTVLEINLGPHNLTIGRESNNDISVDDRYMSSNHARIAYKEGQWFFEDLNSRNGSWKFESQGLRRVMQNIVNDGDLYQLGSTVFRFMKTPTGGPQP